MKNILFGLIPALMWGIQPLVMTKLGSNSQKKLMGMSMGIFLFSLALIPFYGPKNLTSKIFLISLLDGMALSFGLFYQIKGLEVLGVSKGTPISSGSQLLFASLVAALYFKEWQGLKQYSIGFFAIVLIILGISLTSYQEKSSNKKSSNLKGGIIILLLSSLGFVVYTIIPRIFNIEVRSALQGQGLGLLLLSSYFYKKSSSDKILSKGSIKHIITGLIFSLGNISLMISNKINGLALGFTLTQMSLVIASLGGLIFLKEDKSKKEVLLTLIGLILVVSGGILVGLIQD